jgi:hypothetical protein
VRMEGKVPRYQNSFTKFFTFSTCFAGKNRQKCIKC